MPPIAILPVNNTRLEEIQINQLNAVDRSPKKKLHAYLENQYKDKRSHKSRSVFIKQMQHQPIREKSLDKLEHIAIKKNKLESIYRSPSRSSMRSQVEIRNHT